MPQQLVFKKELNHFPYKEGRFLHLTQEEMDTWKDKNGQQYFKFGIYTAEIRGDIDKRLLRVSPDNRYTHIDLTLAHKYGYTVYLLQTNECIFLFHPTETRLAGNALFKEYRAIRGQAEPVILIVGIQHPYGAYHFSGTL